MKKRRSRLALVKKVISDLNVGFIKGGRKPKSGYASCDSLLEQTYTNC
ncbi:hypothetical protein [Kordia sp.]